MCSNAGECQVVTSAVGDQCNRELDCAPGQTCALDDEDENGDGVLAASCQLDQPGLGTGALCESDSQCRNGVCSVGRCTQLCDETSDCPAELACVTLPDLRIDSHPTFSGCLQADGVLKYEIPTSAPFEAIDIPVPGNARSFNLVATAGGDQLVGAARLTAPDGELLYATPFSPQEFFDNPIRHEPGPGVATLFVPNSPAVELMTGVYRAEVSSFLQAGGVGTEVPRIAVFYKLSDSAVLDLHFHFADLTDHPCESSFGGPLSASTAPGLDLFQNFYLPALRGIFEDAGIEIGATTFRDIVGRADLDTIEQNRLGSLLTLGQGDTGINIFFVRNIDPVGVQALAGGNPSPPRSPSSPASGIVVGLDTLCYRDWTTLARITGHAAGQSMGLYRNQEPGGEEDPIPDSPSGSDNLMYFSEFGGTALSAGQTLVLSLWPGLR